MTAENQQERPNYRLHYSTSMGDLGRVFTRCDFYAFNDEDAREKAHEYVDKQQDQFLKTELMGLEKLTHVMRKVEETTAISISLHPVNV